MKRKFFRKLLSFCFILTLIMSMMTACGNKNKDEGGKGDATNDGTDGSAENTQNPEDMPGTDTSDATGEGNEVDGDDIKATSVDATVITEEQMRNIVEDALGRKITTIYDEEYQDEVENQLDILQQKDIYNLDHPLFVINPYGTNRLGMYVFLNTEEDAFLEYTVSVDEQVIYDFTRHLYTDEDTEAESEHEGYVIGLVPGFTNTVTFRSYDGDNAITDKYVYKVALPASDTVVQPILDVTQEESLEELADGLYALFETSQSRAVKPGHILFYDNAGVVRGEIPLDGITGNARIEFVDGNLIYACSDNQFALVNGSGKVEHIYTLNGYQLHHDFDYDEDEDCMIALATNDKNRTAEDCVVLLNLENGYFSELFNMGDLLPDVRRNAVNSTTDPEGEGLGWVQLNSLQIVDSDNLLLGSRELNSILRIDKIRENPKIAYIISDNSFWSGTTYTDLLLEQNGSFTNHAGQYNVNYVTDDTLEKGQYYITILNNNYGNSTSYTNFDYSVITNVGTADEDADNSYYYRYLVDEDAGTYELEDSFVVPYSKVLGSTQDIDGNRVVCSGAVGIYGEYDADGNLITEYKVAVPEGDQLYRVFKYKMDGYWFN